MSQDSICAEDIDSNEYNQGDKDCYMPQDSESMRTIIAMSTTNR